MGLSAGQARLLTITGRKSDCEFQSMRLSHQKIALTRQLADLSNEYQNSLDQTKLIYDFYGTGDTSTQLSYNLLMSPSALNNYMPTLITDSLGRVTLNSNLAKAARAAGIPQEGLGSLPSDTMRNNFIEGLASSGVITTDMANKILGLPYNQSIGFGGGTTVAVQTQDVTFADLKNNYLSKIEVRDHLSSLNKRVGYGSKPNEENATMFIKCIEQPYIDGSVGTNLNTNSNAHGDPANESKLPLSLADLLADDKSYILYIGGDDGHNWVSDFATNLINYESVWAPLFEGIFEALDLGDEMSQKAFDYAKTYIQQSVFHADMSTNYSTLPEYETNWTGYMSGKSKDYSDGSAHSSGIYYTENYVGLGYHKNDGSKHNSYVGVDISRILKEFLTCYVMYANGFSNCYDKFGLPALKVGKQGDLASTEKLIDNNTIFTVKTGTDISSDDLGQAAFYDALFNQLCANGWTENKNIEDNQYLQEMLQSGRLFVSRTKDDGYYYQGNYSTDSYIKEVADETLIAHAEAKYNTEKAKLNQKEEMLDLKMKNLDTEISSLTTEYDTVKNTISKNIEKSFKRYNA